MTIPAADAALDLVTFGEAMLLLIADPGLPLGQSSTFTRQVAGAESNVAIGLARLGHRVGWFGQVGGDAFGTTVLGELRREGVDVSRARIDASAPTGLLVRDCPRGRPVDVVYFRTASAGSRLSASDVDAGYVAGAQILHVSGITPVLSESCFEASAAAIAAAKTAGSIVSFDPNLRSRLCPPERAVPILREICAGADIVLAGLDEGALLSGRDSRSGIAGWFLDRGARFVVLKDGAAGSWATDGQTTVEQPAVAVPVIDPVGAGDAFAAGFLSAYLKGLGLDEIMRQAAAVAGLVVQVAGDTPGLPTAVTLAAVLGAAGDVTR